MKIASLDEAQRESMKKIILRHTGSLADDINEAVKDLEEGQKTFFLSILIGNLGADLMTHFIETSMFSLFGGIMTAEKFITNMIFSIKINSSEVKYESIKEVLKLVLPELTSKILEMADEIGMPNIHNFVVPGGCVN